MRIFGIKSRKQIYFRCIIGGILAIIGFLITMNDQKLNIESVDRLLLASSIAMISFGFGYALPTLLKSKKPIQTTNQYSSISESYQRRHFSEYVKEETLRRQNHRCNSCNRLLNVVDFDHTNGDSSNNDLNNCQALCPNCHAEKSRRKQMGN